MKKIAALAMALSMLTVTALAEQPKADEYRQIMSSGTYYVEYEMDDIIKGLAVSEGKREDYTAYKNEFNPFMLLSPIGALVSLFGGGDKKVPTALYMDGKYYQFQGKKKIYVAGENQLNDENLDPNQSWSSVPYRLALPEELVVFAPDDPFNKVTNYVAPQFVESGENEEGTYDKYSLTKKNKAGGVLYEKIFYFYYKEGELYRIKTFLKEENNSETLINKMKVKKITQTLPKNSLCVPNGYKVYAAGIGDMDDLLDKDVLVEDHSKGE